MFKKSITNIPLSVLAERIYKQSKISCNTSKPATSSQVSH